MSIMILGGGNGMGGGGADLSNDTATPSDVRLGYLFHSKDGNDQQTGAVPNFTGERDGGSEDPGKKLISPELYTRHIPRGCYLEHDIELTAMPQGTETISRDAEIITVTRTEGYMPAGETKKAFPAYTGNFDYAPDFSSGTDIVLSTKGKLLRDDLTLKHDPDLTAGNIKNGVTVFGVTGTYAGSASGNINITANGSVDVTNFATATVNVASGVTPSGEVSVTANGTYNVTAFASAKVAVLPAYELKSASRTDPHSINIPCTGKPVSFFLFIDGNQPADTVGMVSGYIGSTDAKGFVQGRGMGWMFSASWGENSVTVSVDSGYRGGADPLDYQFSAGSYSAWLVYA